MKVLFIGGTGTISSACTRLAIERGIDLCQPCCQRLLSPPALGMVHYALRNGTACAEGLCAGVSPARAFPASTG